MPGTVELSLLEYQALIADQEKLKGTIAQLQAHNAIEMSHLVDERLSRIAGYAVPIVKFAMAHLSPESTHGWPRHDLAELVELLADRPHSTISAEMDEQSWIDDARAFVHECADWDQRRKVRQTKVLATAPKREEVVYMAHPVGTDPEVRKANIQRALRWLRYLVSTYPYAVCAPWLPYVMALDESSHRERGINDDLSVLKLCDRMVLVGGTLSPGMEREQNFFISLGKPVDSLLYLGDEPPEIA